MDHFLNARIQNAERKGLNFYFVYIAMYQFQSQILNGFINIPNP